MESESSIAYAGSFAWVDRRRWSRLAFPTVRDYKRITAKMAGVQWQRNFFDHRLRHDESLAEKFAYICQNPMRAGLVHNEQDWPYVFITGRPNASSW